MISNILSVNAGSSSLKIALYAVQTSHVERSHHHEPLPVLLAHATVSNLTTAPARIVYWRGPKKIKDQTSYSILCSEDAFKSIMDTFLADDELTAMSDPESISHVCHRIVHGGDILSGFEIDGNTMKALDTITDLAPLYNARSVSIVRYCQSKLPLAKNIAYFDTAFHASIPEAIRTYAIDVVIAKQNGLRKYGFHGISYSFMTQAVARFLKKPVGELNIIALHLGSAASACAIKGGKSLDTSMGLTPLDGLPGATCSGGVDPSLIFHFTHDAGMITLSTTQTLHLSVAEEILNEHSGWKALTGTTKFNQIAGSSDHRCHLAFDMFVDRVLGFVGSYYTKLEGKVDALVFSGGVGEGSALLRQAVVDGCECLGFALDQVKNDGLRLHHGTVVEIGEHHASKRVLVCHTDEQVEMARECATHLLKDVLSNANLTGLMHGHEIEKPDLHGSKLDVPHLNGVK